MVQLKWNKTILVTDYCSYFFWNKVQYPPWWWTARKKEALCPGCHPGTGSEEDGLMQVHWSPDQWKTGMDSPNSSSLHEGTKLPQETQYTKVIWLDFVKFCWAGSTVCLLLFKFSERNNKQVQIPGMCSHALANWAASDETRSRSHDIRQEE